MNPLVKPLKANSILGLGLLVGAWMLPVFTSGAQTVTQISAGYINSFYLQSDGSLWGMGFNGFGELGDGTYLDNTHRPEQIIASNVTAVAADDLHTVVLKSDGSLWGVGDWGGAFGEGDDFDINVFAQTVAGNVTDIAVGYEHTLFLKSDGSLWATGNGGLGDGGSDSTNHPEQIVASGVKAITGGYYCSLFLKADGSLWGMGLNDHGQLGGGAFNTTNRPVPIANNVTVVSTKSYHTLFLKSDGSLWAMGNNYSGQLGDGTFATAPPYGTVTNGPEQIVSSNVTAISAGGAHSLFLKKDGSLWAMGYNAHGQLGDGSVTNANRPKQIVSGGVTAIAAGENFSLFLKSDGSLWGMGLNDHGQLGLDAPNFGEIHSPVQIIPYSYLNIVYNGGFETGDFGYWDVFGNTADCLIATRTNYVHSGTYGVQAGPAGSLFFLSQTLNTTPRVSYLLSFYLNSPDGATPNEFRVSWEGKRIFDQTNVPAIRWTNMQFKVATSNTFANLQFAMRGDNTYFGLDDVSVTRIVQPTITASSLAGANLVLHGSDGLNGRTYRTLMSTNLSQPLSQWTAVATNVPGADGNFTITVTNTVSPSVSKRFYTLQMQ